MKHIESEVSNILFDYEKTHTDIKDIHEQWRRMELLLRIVVYEAKNGLPTGLDFEDGGN